MFPDKIYVDLILKEELKYQILVSQKTFIHVDISDRIRKMLLGYPSSGCHQKVLEMPILPPNQMW